MIGGGPGLCMDVTIAMAVHIVAINVNPRLNCSGQFSKVGGLCSG